MMPNAMHSSANFRNAVISEPRVFGPQQGIQTVVGRVPISNTQQHRQQSSAVPAVPPRPFAQQSMMNAPMGMYGNSMYGNSMYGGGYSSYGMSPYSMGGYGAYGRYGGGMYSNGYGMRDPMDPENRFIQLAQESSRPAFQSIESVVGAIGNIAGMLDNTYFALTSSFQAILGVAANFGRLRGVFAQLWSTFALLRGITWLYRKLLYMLGMSKVDPSTVRFNEIFSAAAQSVTGQTPENPENGNIRASVWPILTFLGFIFATPYLIMKLVGQVSTTALEESKNPKSWVKPRAASALYNFKAGAPNELSLYAGQKLILAPREVQQTQKLLNTGWALASIDNKTSGLIPISYVRPMERKGVTITNENSNVVASTPQKPVNDSVHNDIFDSIDVINVDEADLKPFHEDGNVDDVAGTIDSVKSNKFEVDAIARDIQNL